MTEVFPTFASAQEAYDWMEEQVADSCVDNYRFAYEDDAEATRLYYDLKSAGCCGFFDADIIVDGRNAIIGCNYGH